MFSVPSAADIFFNPNAHLRPIMGRFYIPTLEAKSAMEYLFWSLKFRSLEFACPRGVLSRIGKPRVYSCFEFRNFVLNPPFDFISVLVMTILKQKHWCLLMHFGVSLMYFGVLLNHFGCVLMTSDYILIASDDI